MTTTTLTPEWVNRLQDKANRALLDHDWTTLESTRRARRTDRRAARFPDQP